MSKKNQSKINFQSIGQKFNALKEQELFQGVNIADRDLKQLAKNINVKKIKKDKVIIKQGDFASDVFFILNGFVKIIVNGRHIATRKAGTHMGEIAAVLSKMKRTATNIAAEDSYLGVLSSKKFLDFLEKYPKLYKQIAFVLA
jgi:CRP-like cAMP-binding protein